MLVPLDRGRETVAEEVSVMEHQEWGLCSRKCSSGCLEGLHFAQQIGSWSSRVVGHMPAAPGELWVVHVLSVGKRQLESWE